MSETQAAPDRPTCPIRKRFLPADGSESPPIARACGRPLETVEDIATRTCPLCRSGEGTEAEDFAAPIDRAIAMGCIRVLQFRGWDLLATLAGRMLLPPKIIPDGAALLDFKTSHTLNPPTVEVAFAHIDLPPGNWGRTVHMVNNWYLVADGRTAWDLLVDP